MKYHTLEQYRKKMPNYVYVFKAMGLMENDAKLFEGLASMLFMLKMIEEMSEAETQAIHEMFWKAVNDYTGGKIPAEMISRCIEAVNSWENINVTTGGDILDYVDMDE